MKRILVPWLVIVLVVGCSTATSPATISEREAVESVIRGFEEAWNRHDMDSFADLFVEDADFVNVGGRRWVGRKAIKDAHAESHAAHFKNSSLSMRETSIRFLKPDVAVTRSIWDLTGHTTRTGEPAPPRKGILTNVLTRSPEGWKIVVSQNTDIVPPRI